MFNERLDDRQIDKEIEEKEISQRKYNFTHEKKQEERNKKSKELDERLDDRYIDKEKKEKSNTE